MQSVNPTYVGFTAEKSFYLQASVINTYVSLMYELKKNWKGIYE
jgi:hypothetical protein